MGSGFVSIRCLPPRTLPATIYVDAAGVLFDATIPYDARFFESLARVIESQPWLERDKAVIDSLRTLGIEKGKAFNPDEKTRRDSLRRGAGGAPMASTSNTKRVSLRHFMKAGAGPCRQPLD